jgi:hypothetical protein
LNIFEYSYITLIHPLKLVIMFMLFYLYRDKIR